jgi:tagatose-6-phosphate ketose/aldose isomerase
VRVAAQDVAALAAEALVAAGGADTAREIAQQPSVWRAIAARHGAERAPLEAFLAPALGERGRIVLTGAGTSAFVGECLAPAAARATGRRVEAIATTDIVASPHEAFAGGAPTLLVSFARSGNSPESVAAVELARRHAPGCRHLIVTCNADGRLARLGTGAPDCHVLRLPPETDDRGFAMTSSFTGMLYAGALALGVLRPEGADALAAAGVESLASLRDGIGELVARRFRRVVYLGSGPLKGLAREAALKLLELSDGRVVALAETALGFRHGPKTVVDGETLVVLFASGDPLRRRYDRDLYAELRGDGVAGRVLAIAAGQGALDDFPGALVLPAAAALDDLSLCLPYATFAQALALRQSLALGLRPDTPNAAGTVSRVVRGVTIHGDAVP